MNREIKFNIHDKTTDTYYRNSDYDFNIDFGSKTIAITIREGYSEIAALDYEKEIECVLLQFTGLYDDSGKEIYEGDIVKIQDKTETKTFYISEVLITCNGSIVKAHPSHVKLGHEHWRELSWYCDYGVGDENRMGYISCEVIGNIYQNPNLLLSNK